LQTAETFYDPVSIAPLTDHSVLVNFGNRISVLLHEKVIALQLALQQAPFHGFIEAVPAYASLSVHYDVGAVASHTLQSPAAFVSNFLQQLLQQNNNPPLLTERHIKIPVCYAPEFAPDMESLAKKRRLTIEEVIHLHCAVTYRVYMIGFLPGFAYMGTVNEKICTPRKAQPRLQVPAGSVGIAGEQTGIYPIDSPGGWQLIGRTPVALFNPASNTPCMLRAGDQVNFYPISLQEFNSYDVNKNY